MSSVIEAPEWDGVTVLGHRLAIGVADDLLARDEAGTALPDVLGVATSSGSATIRGERLGLFLRTHPRARVVCYDAPRFFWAADSHFSESGDEEGRRALWGLAQNRRLHGLRLFAHLTLMRRVVNFRLLLDGSRNDPTSLPNLRRVWSEATGVNVTARMTSPRSPAAVADAVLRIYMRLHRDVAIEALRSDLKELFLTYGPLGLAVQVQGEIAARWCGDVGLTPYPGLLPDVRQEAAGVIRDLSPVLYRHRPTRDAFSWNGDVLRETNGGYFRTNSEGLKKWVDSFEKRRQLADWPTILPPVSPDGTVAFDPDQWGDRCDLDGHLVAFSDLNAVRSFRKAVQDCQDSIRPAYKILPRLGSSRPNLQKYRRLFMTRVFKPRRGYAFVVGRLPHLALRCLADDIVLHGGDFDLAQWFREGRDPVFELALRLAVPELDLEEERESFLLRGREDPDWGRRWMNIAQSLLDLATRGVGPGCFRELAGPLLDGVGDAESLFERLFLALPEIGRRFVPSLSEQIILDRLEVDAFEVIDRKYRFAFDDQMAQIRNVVAGREPSPQVVRRVVSWVGKRAWRERIERGEVGQEAIDDLLAVRTSSPIGRWQSRTGLSKAQLAEHLDAADDVMKSVLFAVLYAKHHLVAFAGEEFVVEVDEMTGEGALDGIRRVVEEAARRLFADEDLAPPCSIERTVEW